jgi:hypothetical protein
MSRFGAAAFVEIADPASYPFQLSPAIGTGTYFKPSWNRSVFAQEERRSHDKFALNLGERNHRVRHRGAT